MRRLSFTSAARWVGITRVTAIALQFASVLIYSRLLDQHDFGLMAMAAVAINLLNIFRDLGTGSAVVQKQELDAVTTSSILYLNISFGFVLAVALVLASGALAYAFNAQELQLVLIAIAPAFFISAFGIVQQALLEREARFREIAQIEIASGVLSLTCGIAAALAGAGVYTFVVQALVTSLVSTGLLWWISNWSPIRKFSINAVSGVIGFSANVLGFNLLAYVARNLDSVIIGRALGSGALGAYSVAYRIMLFPVENLTSIAARVAFPAFSAIQNDADAVGKAYLRLLGAITFFSAPTMLGVWATRDDFVLVILGEKWREVAGLVTWLAFVGLIQSLVSTTGSLLMGLGRTRQLLRLGIVGVTLMTASFVLGVSWGLEGVAIAYLVANAVNAIISAYVVSRNLHLSLRKLIGAIAPSVAAATFMAAAIVLMTYALRDVIDAAGVRLIIMVLAGGVVYAFAVSLLCRQQVRDVMRLLRISRKGG